MNKTNLFFIRHLETIFTCVRFNKNSISDTIEGDPAVFFRVVEFPVDQVPNDIVNGYKKVPKFLCYGSNF
jgi:hypothetical protein